jgi:hypothetical protein
MKLTTNPSTLELRLFVLFDVSGALRPKLHHIMMLEAVSWLLGKGCDCSLSSFFDNMVYAWPINHEIERDDRWSFWRLDEEQCKNLILFLGVVIAESEELFKGAWEVFVGDTGSLGYEDLSSCFTWDYLGNILDVLAEEQHQEFDSYRSEKWFECLTKGSTGSGDIEADEYPDKMDWGISLDSFYEKMVNSSDILMWYDRFQLEKEALRLLPMPPGLSLM